VSTQLERFDALIARGLATADDKAELEASRQVLTEREATTAALIAVAKASEQRSRKRLDELLSARVPTKKADSTDDVEEARVAAARAEATAKKAEVDALEALRASLQMRAGGDGTVTDVFVQPGQPVIAGDFLVRVIRTGPPQITAYFDEKNARSVHLNDRVALTPSDGASRRRSGRVIALSGALAEVPLRLRIIPNQPQLARSAVIQLDTVDGDDGEPLLPGMAFDVRVEGP
ncbi:MAG TPA: HlyD family efflux transporter periplasmic adaptor subunit, partial [Myxococcota bacterium]